MKNIITVLSELSNCAVIGSKNASLCGIYLAATMISLLLLIACCIFVRQKKTWFVLLFSSVFVIDAGYYFLSVSSNLEMALWANRIAYLGSVLLPLSMLMIIFNVTNTVCKKRLSVSLLVLAGVVFLIAASPGVLDVYYKEVSFEVVNGVSTLVKVYGPLHVVYLFYLLGYFVSMVIFIAVKIKKKAFDETSHAIILVGAVFVNIGVWFIEQITRIEFEMLSISYIISELFLLGVYLMMKENQRLKEIVKQVETVQDFNNSDNLSVNEMINNPIETQIDIERINLFINGVNSLTVTERSIFDAYVARVTTKEVMASLNIKENTLKYHNKNIYSKLCVSSRKELLEIYKQVKLTQTKFEEINSDNK